MVYGFTQHIKDTTQYAFTNWYGDCSTSIFCFHTTGHTISRTHSNAANHIVTQVLHNFYYNFLSIVRFMVMVDVNGVIDSW